jgi:hypothetical protein
MLRLAEDETPGAAPEAKLKAKRARKNKDPEFVPVLTERQAAARAKAAKAAGGGGSDEDTDPLGEAAPPAKALRKVGRLVCKLPVCEETILQRRDEQRKHMVRTHTNALLLGAVYRLCW